MHAYRDRERKRERYEGKERGDGRGIGAGVIYSALIDEGKTNFVLIRGLLHASCESEGFPQVLF